MTERVDGVIVRGEQGVAVSVVIPVLNAESTLSLTLTSILKQTFCEWEAIVVDNCSTDGSLHVANGFAQRDPRFRVLQQRSRHSMAANFNSGLAVATGAWVMFLPADDVIFQECLNHLVTVGSRCKAPAVVVGQFCHISDTGRRVASVVSARALLRRTHRLPPPQAYAAFARAPVGEACTILVSRTVALEIGGLDPFFERTCTWEFFTRASWHGGMAITPRVVAGYRLHEGDRRYPAEVYKKVEHERIAALKTYERTFSERGLERAFAPLAAEMAQRRRFAAGTDSRNPAVGPWRSVAARLATAAGSCIRKAHSLLSRSGRIERELATLEEAAKVG